MNGNPFSFANYIAGGAPILDCVERLLIVASDGAQAFYRLIGTASNRRLFANARRTTSRLLQPRPPLSGRASEFSNDEAADIYSLFNAAQDLFPLIARAVALGISDTCSTFFEEWFFDKHGGHGIIKLQPRMLFPCRQFRLERQRRTEHRLAFSEATSNDYLDWLPDVRLAPAYLPIEIELDFRFDAEVCTVLDPTTQIYAAVSLPPVDFQLLEKAYSVKCVEEKGIEQVFEKAVGIFETVVPRAEHITVETLIELLERAGKAGATIVVLPELCLAQGSIDKIHSALAALPSNCSIRLVVAGSVHAGEGDERTNSQQVFFRLHDEVVCADPHHKMSIFQYKDAEGQRWVEGIQRVRRLRLLMSSGVPIATVVCKDVLEQSLVDMLRRVGVRLLLVSSLSPPASEFRVNLSHLAVSAGTVSLLANTTTLGGDTALFASPRRPSTIMAVPNPDRATVFVFRLQSGDDNSKGAWEVAPNADVQGSLLRSIDVSQSLTV